MGVLQNLLATSFLLLSAVALLDAQPASQAKPQRAHTGAKIHILSKNSHVQVHTFHKIPIFKTVFSQKSHFFTKVVTFQNQNHKNHILEANSPQKSHLQNHNFTKN